MLDGIAHCLSIRLITMLISLMNLPKNFIRFIKYEMKFKVELAEYQRAVYPDKDHWVIVTVKFPFLDIYLWDDGTFKFNLEDFIYKFKDKPFKLIVGKDEYIAVRLHWYDYNQPMRFTFPDNAPPNILLVFQVYMSPDNIWSLYKKQLFISY